MGNIFGTKSLSSGINDFYIPGVTHQLYKLGLTTLEANRAAEALVNAFIPEPLEMRSQSAAQTVESINKRLDRILKAMQGKECCDECEHEEVCRHHQKVSDLKKDSGPFERDDITVRVIRCRLFDKVVEKENEQ